ncbi:hypothetical protein [Nonomuraea dietziae]|uniref:hypothetical protein n=1 Tax=Nonomuraea dietziae TaxID=65515 RepID=UPI0031D124E0
MTLKPLHRLHDVDAILETVARLAPSFGGSSLEDISAPRCFEVEDRLRRALLDIRRLPRRPARQAAIVVHRRRLKNAREAHGGGRCRALRAVVAGAG